MKHYSRELRVLSVMHLTLETKDYRGLNLERSISNLTKRLDRLDTVFFTPSNKAGLSHWKGKPIIPLDDWIEIRDTPYALDFFPDDFDQGLTYISEGGLNRERKQEDAKKWDSDYQELMEYTKNSNYGRIKCFHCLLSPDGDDPIFIGINRLVIQGLSNGRQEKDLIQYPCKVVNRFECPYERNRITKDHNIGSTNSDFDTEDLFRLQKMSFLVEIALARVRKEDLEIQIKDKQGLLTALADRDIFIMVLEQASDTLKSTEYLREISPGQDIESILNYFTGIQDKVCLEELRFY
ncbi:MAG: hypothetical protein GEU26_11865 [Nitrososphaeraceae archaeon]|nr:hypothetical protein [Nitrososphaeraceae archaeon]